MKQTKLDNITKNTKIVIDSPAQIFQVRRTPTKCSISKNTTNNFLPTITHIQSTNTKIAHMRDNNIGSTTAAT